MKNLLLAGAALASFALVSQANAAAFPNFGNNTAGPSLIITIGSNGQSTITNGLSTGPYDGSDDTYIGVINNSAATVNSINVASNGANIFGFETDGIDTYGAPETAGNPDTTGYGGPISFFTNISSAETSGTVNFFGGLAAGGQTYFSLEEALTTSTFTGGGGGISAGGVPEPASWLLMMAGIGVIGGTLRVNARKVRTSVA